MRIARIVGSAVIAGSFVSAPVMAKPSLDVEGSRVSAAMQGEDLRGAGAAPIIIAIAAILAVIILGVTSGDDPQSP